MHQDSIIDDHSPEFSAYRLDKNKSEYFRADFYQPEPNQNDTTSRDLATPNNRIPEPSLLATPNHYDAHKEMTPFTVSAVKPEA